MEKYDNKFKSNMEALNLHVALNNELEKFHKCIQALRNSTMEDALHLELDRSHIVASIHNINSSIKSLATMQKIS